MKRLVGYCMALTYMSVGWIAGATGVEVYGLSASILIGVSFGISSLTVGSLAVWLSGKRDDEK